MSVPAGHRALTASEQIQPRSATLLGATDPQERITARVIVRRRTDVTAAADIQARLHMHPAQREPLSAAEHARRFGAAQADLDPIAALLTSGGLQIEEIDAASRTILASGTATQFGTLFSVTLERYEAPILSPGKGRPRQPELQTYRSFTGSIHVPAELADLIVGVFGLDNRRISARNTSGDPPVTSTTTVPQVMQRYNFPTNKATGQTIAILAVPNVSSGQGGYLQSDINSYYAAAALNGFTAPTPTDVTDIDGTRNNAPNPDTEVTQDICIASTVAQGATIAVYFNAGDQNGWLGVLTRATFPRAGDPTPSVLSSSFSICGGGTISSAAPRQGFQPRSSML
jgi:kumamolisin